MPVTRIKSTWTSGNLVFFPDTNDTGSIIFGDSTNNLYNDVQFYLGASTKYVLFDVGNSLLTLEDIDLKLGDNDVLEFGDASGGDVYGRWDGTDYDMLAAANNTIWKWGNGTNSFDMWWYGSAAANYMEWDASANALYLRGTASLFQVAASASVVGSGVVLSATKTSAFRVYTDDGNAAIASSVLTRAGVFRNLQVYTGGNREQEASGVVGQIVSVAGTNRHNMSGVMGSYEASTSLTVDGQAASTDPWVQAAVIGRVGVGTNITTINANGILAGLAAMSNTVSFQANNGMFAGLYIGAWGSAIAWSHGIYAEAPDVKQFIVLLGGTSADAGTAGTVFQAGTLAVPVDINTASAFGVKVFTRSTSTAAHTNARFRAIGNAASGTPTIEGVLAQASVADAKYGGSVQGLIAHARIGSASVMGGAQSIITAGRFKTEDARATDGTSTAPTYAGNVYGITVQGQISAAPTGDYVGIHFDCQTAAASTAQPWDSVFDFQIGGENANITNLFNFPSGGGWATAGKMIVHGGAAAAAVAGYLHIAVNGTQYRIPYLVNADS